MSSRVVLHVGTMKSGTSYVQSILGGHKQELLASGAEFVGGFGVQTRAVRRMLRLPEAPRRNRARWLDLAARVHASPAEVSVVSMEFLGFATEAQVEELVSPLRGLEVSVVVTVRDQLRAVAAQWQTFTRNQGKDDWASYLRLIEDPEGGSRAHRVFHRAQDVPVVAARWGDHPAVAGVGLVTVPGHAPASELWRRFATAAGLDASIADPSVARRNDSLGYASCDVLRRANTLLTGLPGPVYRALVREAALGPLGALRALEERPVLDRTAAAAAARRNADIRALVTGGRVGLTGDLEDLPVDADPSGYPDAVSPPDPAHVLRAARALHEHARSALVAATGAGSVDPVDPVDPPGPGDEVDRLVAESAALLRAVAGTR